jgi:hypothetical protein
VIKRLSWSVATHTYPEIGREDFRPLPFALSFAALHHLADTALSQSWEPPHTQSM